MNRWKSVTLISILGFFPLNVYSVQEVQELELESGTRIRAQIRTPVESSGRLPAMIVLGGFKNAAKVLDLVEVPHPIVLASFDYPFEAPRNFQFPLTLKYAPSAKKTILETIEGIGELVNALNNHPRVDPNRIFVLGASLGAPFAIYGARKFTQIHGLVVVHGFGQGAEVIERQIKMKLQKKISFGLGWISWLLSRLGWIYLGLDEIEEAASQLHMDQVVLVIQPKEDQNVGREAQESLIWSLRNSRAKVEVQWMDGGHLKPGEEHRIREILGRVWIWMKLLEV